MQLVLHPDCVFELSATRRYLCKNGSWACDGYHDGGAKSAKLGDLARAVDRQLRAAIDFPAQLKDRAEPKYLVKMIDAEVADYLAYKEAHRPVVVDIDFAEAGADPRGGERHPGGAARRRGAGGRTAGQGARRGSTFVAEPGTAREQGRPEPETSPAPSGSDPQDAIKDPFGLAAEERALVEALLAGRQAPVAKTSADLLVDAINEKLFDLVGDTVVEPRRGRRRAELIEDYADDVRKALGLRLKKRTCVLLVRPSW